MATKKPAKKLVKKPLNFFVWLRSGLRSMSRKYPPIYAALAAAKKPYKGDNPRQKVCYECADCKLTYAAKEVSIDHIEDCGKLSSWQDVQGFMERLFCGEAGLQVLCSDCHDLKTYISKYDVSKEEARLLKGVAAITKLSVAKQAAWLADKEVVGERVSNQLKRKAEIMKILKGELDV